VSAEKLELAVAVEYPELLPTEPRASTNEERTSAGLVHGVDCGKASHDPRVLYYAHSSTEDGPYEIAGRVYCGRCHASFSDGVAVVLRMKARVTLESPEGGASHHELKRHLSLSDENGDSLSVSELRGLVKGLEQQLTKEREWRASCNPQSLEVERAAVIRLTQENEVLQSQVESLKAENSALNDQFEVRLSEVEAKLDEISDDLDIRSDGLVS